MVGIWHLLALSMDVSCRGVPHLEMIFHMLRAFAVRRDGLTLSRFRSLVNFRRSFNAYQAASWGCAPDRLHHRGTRRLRVDIADPMPGTMAWMARSLVLARWNFRFGRRDTPFVITWLVQPVRLELLEGR